MNQIRIAAEALFDDSTVKFRSYDEGAITIEIQPDINVKSGQYFVDKVNISSDKLGYICMDIDSYHWEFDDNHNKAVEEIQKYLVAIKSSHLMQKRSIFGSKLTISSE